MITSQKTQLYIQHGRVQCTCTWLITCPWSASLHTCIYMYSISYTQFIIIVRKKFTRALHFKNIRLTRPFHRLVSQAKRFIWSVRLLLPVSEWQRILSRYPRFHKSKGRHPVTCVNPAFKNSTNDLFTELRVYYLLLTPTTNVEQIWEMLKYHRQINLHFSNRVSLYREKPFEYV